MSAVLEHPLLAGIGERTLSELVGRLRFETIERRHYACRRPGQGADLCLVLDGLLLEVIETYAGQRIVLDAGGPGVALGLPDSAGGSDAEPRGRLAVLRTEIAAFPLAELETLAKADPVLSRNLLAEAYQKARRRSAHLVAMAHSPALARVAQHLLAFRDYLGLSHELPSVVIPSLTHSDLADIAGVRRETVTIQLQCLKRIGAIVPCGEGLRLEVGLLAAVAEGRAAKGASRQSFAAASSSLG